MTSNNIPAMNRRRFLVAVPLLSLAYCSPTINVPVDVRDIVDGIVDGLLKFAPADLAGQLQTLRKQLETGGDWKATTKALIPVVQSILSLGVVPEPYATLAKTALSGLGMLLGIAGAPGDRVVSIDEAKSAAARLRALTSE